jgi:hypothetical protein
MGGLDLNKAIPANAAASVKQRLFVEPGLLAFSEHKRAYME